MSVIISLVGPDSVNISRISQTPNPEIIQSPEFRQNCSKLTTVLLMNRVYPGQSWLISFCIFPSSIAAYGFGSHLSCETSADGPREGYPSLKVNAKWIQDLSNEMTSESLLLEKCQEA